MSVGPENSDHARTLSVAGNTAPILIQVDTGKHAAQMFQSALVCGACVVLSIVCAGIAWWAVTEHRVTQGIQKSVLAESESLRARIERLEQREK